MAEIVSILNVRKEGKEFDLEQVESYYTEKGYIELRFKEGGTLSFLEFEPKKKGAVLVDSETHRKIWQILTLRNVVDHKITKTI